MREFQERRRIKKFLHSRYAIAVLALVLILVAHSLWNVYTKYKKSVDIAERMNADAVALEDRQTSLKRSIDMLNTPEGKEREALDRFGTVKEGERVIVLVDDSASSSEELPPVHESMWSRFFSFFGF